jgi:hypothetical protein
LSRRLSLRLASWRALTCMPAAMATCPRYTDRRQQRSGVVKTRGTVGVC